MSNGKTYVSCESVTLIVTSLLLPSLAPLVKAQADATLKPPTFSEIATQAGIRFRHHASRTTQKYLIETMGAGVAWLDYDRDNRLDLFFVNGAAVRDPMSENARPDKHLPRYWNRLYRNIGAERFEDVTEEAGLRGSGYGMGVAVGDYDNDGWPDLYVTNFDGNLLFHNEGDGTFRDVTSEAGVAAGGWSAGAAFLDDDRDGDLDLFVARYMQWSFEDNPLCETSSGSERMYCHPDLFESTTHLLYRNLGDGRFREVGQETGIADSTGKGLGVALNDYDRDGWIDIFVANDSDAQQLFHNDGDGAFTEMGLFWGVAYDADGQEFAGMGTDFEDFDNDGWPDIFVNALSLEGYVLLRNKRTEFEDIAGRAGIARLSLQFSGWGTQFIDYDNDGWKDLFVAQAHVLDNVTLDSPKLSYEQPLLMLRNLRGTFEDVSGRSGEAFRAAWASRGASIGDFNNDGFIDVAVNTNNGAPLLLRNNGNGGRWITVDAVGSHSNRDGIGARVRIVGSSGVEQHGMVSTAGSYLSGNDKRLHFGMGEDRTVKEIEIVWPSGAVQRLTNISTNQILSITEPPKE